eukprot:2370855-Amphidinium_carterae.1
MLATNKTLCMFDILHAADIWVAVQSKARCRQCALTLSWVPSIMATSQVLSSKSAHTELSHW